MENTLSLAAHLGIKTFPVRTYMSCSWLFEDRTETWLTTSRSRIGNFPIINNRKRYPAIWLASGKRDAAIKNCDSPVL